MAKISKKGHDLVVMNLSEITSDTAVWTKFGKDLAPGKPWKNKFKKGNLVVKSEHPFDIEGFELNLCIRIDCPVLPKTVQIIDDVVYKRKMNLYIVCGKKARLAKIEHLYQMIRGKVINLDIRDKDRRKYNIVMAKKCLRTLTKLDYRVPVKEATSYNGNYMAKCDISEATDIMIKEYTYVYYHGNVLNVVCDGKKLTKKQKDRYRAMNPIVVFNMTQDDIPVVKESMKWEFYNPCHPENVSSYQRYFIKFFNIGTYDKKVDFRLLDDEYITYMMDTLTKMCQDFVEQASDYAYEFINSFVNINLRYEDYLEINSVLHLPGVVDFVVSNMIRERDIEVESFYEDRKDDDYESINSSYLGEDE
jgi:hypothetical protein